MFVDLVAGGDIVMHRHHKMNGPVVITNPLSTYGFRKFHHCGFYVDQFEGNSILLEELLNVINDMKYFDDISIAKKIFNESANPDLSFNRYMISHANIVQKCTDLKEPEFPRMPQPLHCELKVGVRVSVWVRGWKRVNAYFIGQEHL